MGVGEDILNLAVGGLSGYLDDRPDSVYQAKHPTLPVESLPGRATDLYGQVGQLTGEYTPMPQVTQENILAQQADDRAAALQGAQRMLNLRGQGHGLAERSPLMQHEHTDLLREYMAGLGDDASGLSEADYARWAADRRFGLGLQNRMLEHASTLTEAERAGDLERILEGLFGPTAGQGLLGLVQQLLRAMGGGDDSEQTQSDVIRAVLGALARASQGLGQGGANPIDWSNLQQTLGDDLGLGLLDNPALEELLTDFFRSDTPGIDFDLPADFTDGGGVWLNPDIWDANLGDLGLEDLFADLEEILGPDVIGDTEYFLDNFDINLGDSLGIFNDPNFDFFNDPYRDYYPYDPNVFLPIV